MLEQSAKPKPDRSVKYGQRIISGIILATLLVIIIIVDLHRKEPKDLHAYQQIPGGVGNFVIAVCFFNLILMYELVTPCQCMKW